MQMTIYGLQSARQKIVEDYHQMNPALFGDNEYIENENKQLEKTLQLTSTKSAIR